MIVFVGSEVKATSPNSATEGSDLGKTNPKVAHYYKFIMLFFWHLCLSFAWLLLLD